MSQYRKDMIGWEQCLECGNHCFAEGENLSAYNNFQDAVAIARQLFCKHPTNKCVVKALLISHQNLADLHVKEQALDLAYQELATVNNCIEDVVERYQSCRRKLPDSLLWGKSISLKKLLLFEQTYCH
jgi:hypothetical protein